MNWVASNSYLPVSAFLVAVTSSGPLLSAFVPETFTEEIVLLVTVAVSAAFAVASDALM